MLSFLPPEIWFQVFRWATYFTYHANNPYLTEPFESLRTNESNIQLSTKRTLALVCQQWRILSTELLYEDIIIRRGADDLKRVLQKHDGFGRMVRRLELPYASTQTPTSDPLTAVKILQLCPNLEVLVRGPPTHLDDLIFEFDVPIVPLFSLKRLEWWHYGEAARSGGINSLNAVLKCAPNLRYLSVGGSLRLDLMKIEPIHLPVLTTLRLQVVNGLFIRQICRWSLPALTDIIADTPIGRQALESIWETYGYRLQVVEFGKHLRFYIDDNLTPSLEHCPSLQELNYYIHFTKPPRLSYPHTSLTTVGLHADANHMLDDGDWGHVEEHFQLYAGPIFPNLERVRLYGEWHAIMADARFTPLERGLRARGCKLELPKAPTQTNSLYHRCQ